MCQVTGSDSPTGCGGASRSAERAAVGRQLRAAGPGRRDRESTQTAGGVSLRIDRRRRAPLHDRMLLVRRSRTAGAVRGGRSSVHRGDSHAITVTVPRRRAIGLGGAGAPAGPRPAEFGSAQPDCPPSSPHRDTGEGGRSLGSCQPRGTARVWCVPRRESRDVGPGRQCPKPRRGVGSKGRGHKSPSTMSPACLRNCLRCFPL
jgi:hypothetical protein